jgi:hypothetical protein
VPQQLPPDAAPAPFWLDEQIFEIEAGLAREGRKRSEEHREADRLVAKIREADLRGRLRTEELLTDRFLCCRDAIREPLIFGEALDHAKYYRGVAGRRGNDPESIVL